MKISNIANNKADSVYELEIIGTLQEVEGFGTFTDYTADFVEEEGNGKYSITIMASDEFTKKEFKEAVTAQLKAFRKIN